MIRTVAGLSIRPGLFTIDGMNLIASTMMLFSVLMPAKMWFAPGQPINVRLDYATPVVLVMTDFAGKPLAATGKADLAAGATADLATVFPQIKTPGCYLVSAHAKADGPMVGTPLVITARENKEPGAPPGLMVTKVEPLCYAKMQTDLGEMDMLFYYDVAPNTANDFLTLAGQGYYDGLTFHRILPGFVLQGGDPAGNGTGGPGYGITAEFNDRPHDAGVLSMARQGDPMEQTGAMPRKEFADSAGSQFFICLDPKATYQLNGKYTAFGKVFKGMDVANKIAQVPLSDPAAGSPEKPVVIQKVTVVPVTAGDNPYVATSSATTRP